MAAAFADNEDAMPMDAGNSSACSSDEVGHCRDMPVAVYRCPPDSLPFFYVLLIMIVLRTTLVCVLKFLGDFSCACFIGFATGVTSQADGRISGCSFVLPPYLTVQGKLWCYRIVALAVGGA